MFSAGYSSYDPAILNEIFSRFEETVDVSGLTVPGQELVFVEKRSFGTQHNPAAVCFSMSAVRGPEGIGFRVKSHNFFTVGTVPQIRQVRANVQLLLKTFAYR